MRAIVSVGTSELHVRGLNRMFVPLQKYGLKCNKILYSAFMNHWPKHSDKPFAFKCSALRDAVEDGYDQLLWLDSSILPLRSLEPIWEIAEREGVWLARNGWFNSFWTNNAAYPILGITREENDKIPHVVGGAFAVDLRHPKGGEFFKQFCHYGLETRAFVGPLTGGVGVQHRNDQTVLSVIAWRLEIPLTDCPAYFAYAAYEADGSFVAENQKEETILCAEGRFI